MLGKMKQRDVWFRDAQIWSLWLFNISCLPFSSRFSCSALHDMFWSCLLFFFLFSTCDTRLILFVHPLLSSSVFLFPVLVFGSFLLLFLSASSYCRSPINWECLSPAVPCLCCIFLDLRYWQLFKLWTSSCGFYRPRFALLPGSRREERDLNDSNNQERRRGKVPCQLSDCFFPCRTDHDDNLISLPLAVWLSLWGSSLGFILIRRFLSLSHSLFTLSIVLLAFPLAWCWQLSSFLVFLLCVSVFFCVSAPSVSFSAIVVVVPPHDICRSVRRCDVCELLL